MPPPPFVTCCSTVGSDGFSASRFGPTLPFEAAAFSVWQLPQPAEAKIALPFGFGAAAAGRAVVVVGRRGPRSASRP